MSGAQKRKLRGLRGRLEEAEYEMRRLGFSRRQIGAVAVREQAAWARWARTA